VLGLAAGASAQAGRPAGSGPGWTVTTAPFSISFVSGSMVLTEEAAPAQHGPGPAHRLSYQTADGKSHSLTNALSSSPIPNGVRYTVATDEPDRTATVELTQAGDAVEVHWTLTPATGVTTVWEALDAYPDEHFLGGGENENAVDLTHQVVPFKVWHPCRAYAPVPFYASSRGYGIAVATSAIGRAEFAGPHSGTTCDLGPEAQCPLANAQQEVQLCFRASSLTYDVYVGPPARTLGDYVRATGLPMLPPKEEFGLVQWRDVVSGPGDLIADATTLQRLRIPIDWVELDNPWEKLLCYGSLQFGPPKFPGDPRTWIAAIHRLGVKLMIWVSPYVRTLPGCPTPAYPSDALLGSGNSLALDLTRPDIYATFVAKLKALRALGVDGVKADRADEIDLEGMQLADGAGVDLQNLYPQLFDKAIQSAFGAPGSGTWAGYVRAASPRSRTLVPGIWAGDQQGTFTGLQDAVRAAASAAASGFPVWGSDIGGYDSSMLTPEVFVRWAQLGAISPIFEVGGAGPNANFWTMGSPTVAQFRAASILHYELFPYLYQLARVAAGTGAPILRPLGYAFPNDDEAWAADLELMVGPSVLALPVTTPTGQPVDEYFPGGRWVSLWGDHDVVGPRQVVTGVPLGTLPLYLRAGSAVPLDFRTPLVWNRPWGVNDLDRPGRIGWVYAPANGTTHVSSADERFAASTTAHQIQLAVTGHREEVELLVLTPRVPRSVLVNGRAVGRAVNAAALRTPADGWMLARSRFHGIVVKVTTAQTVSRVTIRF
jgi:alpha-D-xyloside xylohydrolase